MAESAGTLETIALELGNALKPLKDLMGVDIFVRLGLQLPPSLAGNNQIMQGLTKAGNLAKKLEPDITALQTAIDDENTSNIISSATNLISDVVQLVTTLKELGDAVHGAANALSGAEKTALQALASELPVRILEYMTVGYLDDKSPTLTNTLALLGLIDKEFKPSSGVETSPAPAEIVPRRIYLSNIVKLFSDPLDYLEDRFEWGKAGFNDEELLRRVQSLLFSLGIPADLYQAGSGPWTLEAYYFNIKTDTSTTPPGLEFELSLPGATTYENEIDFSDLWKGTVDIEAAFQAGLKGNLTPPFDISLKPPTGNVQLEILLGLMAKHSDGSPVILIGATGGTRLQAKSLAGKIGAKANFGTSGGSVVPSVGFEVEDGKLIIDFSQGDGFINQILSEVSFEAGFELQAQWDPKTGLRFEGSGGLEIQVPVHIDLVLIEIKGLYFSVYFSTETPIKIGLATNFKSNLGPLVAVIDEIGTNIPIKFPSDGKGNLGIADIDFKFRPPKGVGLSLDVGVIKGGGYLFLDFEKGEYAGALEFTFSEVVSLKAIGIITTKMPDGSDGFSMLIIITAEFGTGIQLGFGFTLLGVGGLMGLNRTMKLEKIAQGVRDGGINSIMFPQDVVANAQKIISDLKTYFPVEEGKFLIGPMAKIGWGTPTLISISLGIIIEIPGNIAILGVIKIALPDEEAALLILQVNFIGAIEFDKERLWFFASMFGSRVLFITIDGEMGLLIAWGGSAEFVSSIGGFHPVFNPPPLPFPNPVRISFNILNESWGKVRVMGYFAVTSNTVQFGARVEIYFGFSALSVNGHIAFDALFQFSPFYFIIAISASFSVKVFGAGLFSVRVKMSLEGPTPWRVKGTGSISILFFDIDVDFDKTWGDKKNTTLPPIQVMPLVKAEYGKLENWQAALPASNNLLVTLSPLDETEDLVLHPVGTLKISQRAIPLDITLDKVGAQKPSDADKFSLEAEGSTLDKVKDLNENFPLAQFQEMENNKKLSRPSFEKEHSGIEMSVKDKSTVIGKAVKRVVRYETFIIDKGSSFLLTKLFGFFNALFQHFFLNNAASKSELSYKVKKQFVPNNEVITVKTGGYSVAFTADNKPFSGEAASFDSEALAQEFVKGKLAEDPNLADEIHVIPANEINTAA